MLRLTIEGGRVYENDLRMLQDHLEFLERALNAMAWLYHTGKL